MTHNAFDRELLRRQLHRLREAASQRSRLEHEITAEFETETEAAKQQAEAALAAAEKQFAGTIEALRREHAAVNQKADADAVAERAKLDTQRSSYAATVNRTCENERTKLAEDAQFEANSTKEVFKEKRAEPTKLLRRAEKEMAAVAAQLDEAAARTRKFLADRRIAEPTATEAAPAAELPSGGQLLPHLEQLRAAVADTAAKLLGLRAAATAFAGGTRAAAILLPVVMGIAAAVAAVLLTPGSLPEALVTKLAAAGGALVTIAGGGAGVGLWLVARMRTKAGAEVLAMRTGLVRQVDEARRCLTAATGFLKTRHDAQLAKLDATFAAETRQRKEKAEADLAAVTEKRDKLLAELEAKYKEAVDKAEKKRAVTREAAEKNYPPRLEALSAERTARLAQLARTRDERLAAAGRRRDERWQEMTAAWKTARTETAAVYDEANRIDAAAFPAWEQLATEDCPLPTSAPPGLRFGQLDLTLEKVPGGVSSRPEFNAYGPISWKQPALVPFPVEASLLVKTTSDQKEIASEMMQALMLRIASGVPAGQTRFTIIDPVGLGKQFAGFMHLADYDELLVTSRIWTEPPQIEQCLADITEQIELVIQKYLRNEYESIGDYNADAEVPEPYRFVVVANFPANFTETSARRLASIASSGARCGVYTIVSVDTSQHMPANFSLADLEKHATTLVLKDGVPTWSDPDFGKWPLAVERPPTEEVFTQIIQRVGKAAKAAKRVEVPFDRVAPKEEEWWTGSTAGEVLAPL
ncbi:MAG: hypothetical protein ACKOK8_05100, partial [Planctomycetia bacterium]